jgi:hypothetical protein
LRKIALSLTAESVAGRRLKRQATRQEDGSNGYPSFTKEVFWYHTMETMAIRFAGGVDSFVAMKSIDLI